MTSKGLIPGSAYFIMMFADEALNVPLIQTVVFEQTRSVGGHDEYWFSEMFADREPAKFRVAASDRETLLMDRRELIARLSNLEDRNHEERAPKFFVD